MSKISYQNFPSPDKRTRRKQQQFWVGWGLFILACAVLFIMVVGGTVRAARNYYLTFLRVAGLNSQDLVELVKDAWQQKQNLAVDDNFLFLILGTDSLDYRPGDKVMTDTIILANLNLASQQLSLLSIPRDIFLPDRQEKINSLYNDALQAGAINPERAVADYLGNLIGEPVDATFVFTLDQVEQLIDRVGGIEVNVDRGFTDELYPRSGVDVTVERDPRVLYETVTFEPGKQKMDGATALKYMRSRHAQGPEGSDLARAARQQKVIEAFLIQGAAKILDRRTVLNFVLLGDLYRFYQDNYERYFPTSLTLALALQAGVLNANQALPRITQHVLSVYPTEADGVLREPTSEEMEQDFYGAWAWVVPDWSALIAEIRTDLNLNSASLDAAP